MNSAMEELVRSLLYEGYALYPYTPGVKNATPTPFGIVYPPAYSETQPAAFSMLRLEAVLQGGPDARISGRVLFLQATGEGHEAADRSLELGPVTLAQLARGPVRETFAFPMDGSREMRGRVAMRRELLSPTLARVRLCLHNETEMPGDPAQTSRGDALRHSLISTHPLLEAEGGHFVSPLERHGPEGEAALASEPVNTFPVLLGDEDRALLGAAIVLPDHPELAPGSLGNLFDNTEIEEALLLHVHALSEDEREADLLSGPGGARDDRAGRVDHRRGHPRPARPAHLQGAGCRRATRDQRQSSEAASGARRDPGRARGRCGGDNREARRQDRAAARNKEMSTTRSCTGGPRPWSASTAATTSGSISA